MDSIRWTSRSGAQAKSDARTTGSSCVAHDDARDDDLVTLNRADRDNARALLRRVLDAVDRGDLTADGPAAVGVVRRLEGALLALREIDEPREQVLERRRLER